MLTRETVFSHVDVLVLSASMIIKHWTFNHTCKSKDISFPVIDYIVVTTCIIPSMGMMSPIYKGSMKSQWMILIKKEIEQIKALRRAILRC